MWTEERIEQAKAWVADGVSAAEIATRFGGGMTRSAVIGKMHRLGLKGGGGKRCGIPGQGRPRRKQAASNNRHFKLGYGARFQSPVAIPPKPVREPPKPPQLLMLGILDLKPTNCKFPIGDPRHADFGYCGQKRFGSSPYCEYHHRLAYVPVRGRTA